MHAVRRSPDHRFDHRFDRRSLLAGAAALPALATLPRWLAAWPAAARSERALIVVWMDGGMSHIDTFDGKPEASTDIRGELTSREASVEGVFVSEHLPELARRIERCVLVRSLTSGEGNHDRGSHYMLTGHRPSAVLTHPSCGAFLSRDALAGVEALPAYVAIPQSPEYGRHGFLPITCGPFEIEGDPSRAGFAVKHLSPRPDMRRALDLLERIDALDGKPRSPSERARDDFLAAARTLSLDPAAREVFDLGREEHETRERYGHDRLGQSCLLARRLVEAGTRTVLVRYEGWDHHQSIRNALTYGFPPKLVATDRALSALFDDLERRGLAERVLVVLASEFGRTPRVNPAGGRDHWPRAHSALLFGAGLRAGSVIGKTDVRGEEPIERALSPADLHATMLAALDVDLETVLRTPDGRPVRLVEEGASPAREALAARQG